jgi:SAM-dependent methyltransferase
LSPSVRQWIHRLKQPRVVHLPFPRLDPVSRFGFERGQPIDRYFIEKFLQKNRESIRGVCLEVRDDSYTRQFGGAQVTRSDVLDIDTGNARANIYGDLRRLTNVPADSYDCIILTQVLQYIDDPRAAIGEAYRILKPGGCLLATVPMLGRLDDRGVIDFWRYTPNSARHVLETAFPASQFEVATWGNMLTSVAFLMGLAREDLRHSQLNHVDPYYSCVISIRAIKPPGGGTRQGDN